jgi:reductive dehalogenase
LKRWKHSPYIVDETAYRRFSERDTIFARVQNDPDFEDYQVGISSHLDVILQAKRPGYSRIDQALSSASWTLYHHFRGAFSWNKLTYATGAKFDEGLSEPSTDRLEVKDPERMTHIMKQAAKSFGAALVGVCKLDRNWLYTHDRNGTAINIPSHMENVVVMAVEMDLEALQTTPAFPGAFATGNGYSRMAFAQVCLAEFIRELGFDAIPAGNNLGLSVPLAIDAGLGQYGRHGLLITPEFGSNVRLCKVFTNLPLISDFPIDFGALEFCRTCKRCAEACPSFSISYDENPSWVGPTRSNNPGILKYYVNVESCYNYWTLNGNDCSRCIVSCPFTKNRHWSHGITRFFIKHLPWLNRLWTKLDRWMGYGKQRKPSSFWKPEKEFIHTRKGN